MQTGNPPIRRVVTGHDSSHVAKVLRDEPATNTKSAQPGQVSTLIWCTDGAPAAIPIGEQPEDMGARKIGTAPPAHGTRFAVIDFPPGNQAHMHRTETIDYVIVIEGEIEMDMDASSVKLKATSWSSVAPTTPGQTEATSGPAWRSSWSMRSRWVSALR